MLSLLSGHDLRRYELRFYVQRALRAVLKYFRPITGRQAQKEQADREPPEVMKLSDWVAHYGEEGLAQLVDIMYVTYCLDPIWQYGTPKEKVRETVLEMLSTDAWIVVIRYEGRIVSYGIGYDFRGYEFRKHMLRGMEDSILADQVAEEKVFLIDTISTLPEYQGNGAMKYVFADLQRVALRYGYRYLISWTSSRNLSERLNRYFHKTGRRRVGEFQPPRFHDTGIILLKDLLGSLGSDLPDAEVGVASSGVLIERY